VTGALVKSGRYLCGTGDLVAAPCLAASNPRYDCSRLRAFANRRGFVIRHQKVTKKSREHGIFGGGGPLGALGVRYHRVGGAIGRKGRRFPSRTITPVFFRHSPALANLHWVEIVNLESEE